MPTGSCFCGNFKIGYTGEPVAKALCHCIDCRKISGSTYSTNAIVPEQGFKVTQGTPKTITKTADSGNKITSFFCGECGSTLYREIPGAGTKVVKIGVMDDIGFLNQTKPAVELFVPQRVSWVPEIKGCAQKKGMQDSADC